MRVAIAESRTVPVEIQAIGNVEAFTTVSLKSQVAGTLDRVHFQEGDFVREGDLLIEIDPRQYEEALREAESNLVRNQAALRQAEAAVSQAQAAAGLASTQAERARRLMEEGVGARQQFDVADSELKSREGALKAADAAVETARATVQGSEVAISRAELNLSYCRITAPVSGRTGSLAIQPGNLIRASDLEIVSIYQIQPIFVSFTVPENQLPQVQRRMRSSRLPVTAIIQDVEPESVHGSVTFIDNAVDTTTGTIRLKGSFSNSPAKLWPGQYVNVRLLIDELPNATVVPTAAVQTSQDGDFVFVVTPDETVEQRFIQVAQRSEGYVALSKGVQPGERVVTEGQIRLTPGAKVRVIS